MKKYLTALLVLSGFISSAQPQFQLAPPMLNYKSAFFAGSTQVELRFDQPGTAIHYTLNGKEPGPGDPVYTKPIRISKRTLVKAKAMGAGFIPSQTVSAEFVKEGKPIHAVTFSQPNEYYKNAAPNILHDNDGGRANYHAGGWLGYTNDTAIFVVELKKKETLQAVLLDLLQDENSWIFLPASIQLYYYDEQTSAYVLATKHVPVQDAPSPKACRLLEMKLPKGISAQKFKLELLTVNKIPDWHTAKGNPAWLFIDEIKVY